MPPFVSLDLCQLKSRPDPRRSIDGGLWESGGCQSHHSFAYSLSFALFHPLLLHWTYLVQQASLWSLIPVWRVWSSHHCSGQKCCQKALYGIFLATEYTSRTSVWLAHWLNKIWSSSDFLLLSCLALMCFFCEKKDIGYFMSCPPQKTAWGVLYWTGKQLEEKGQADSVSFLTCNLPRMIFLYTTKHRIQTKMELGIVCRLSPSSPGLLSKWYV